jgi:uncharacterized protein DUF4435
MSLSSVMKKTPLKTLVVLSATNSNVSIVLVEGKDDKKLLQNYFADSVVILFPKGNTNNKGEVISSINFISSNPKHQHKKSRVLGIIDADFNRIQHKVLDYSNLLYTDKHDMDAQIFASKALKKFFNICFYENDSINSEHFIRTVRTRCVDIAKEFGFYKLTLEKLKLQRIKREISIDQVINSKFHIDLGLLIIKLSHLEGIGLISSAQVKLIVKTMDEIKSKALKENHDPYQYANGHDLLIVLSKFILHNKFKLKKEHLGKELLTLFKKDPKSRMDFIKELENYLRLAYELRWFMQSDLYKQIQAFESQGKAEIFDSD